MVGKIEHFVVGECQWDRFRAVFNCANRQNVIVAEFIQMVVVLKILLIRGCRR